MKKIATLLLMFIFCFSVYAETEIPLKEKYKKGNTGVGRERTEILVPYASIEDGVINIETERATWGVTATIYNSDSVVIYTSVSPIEGKVHEFPIDALSADCYTLEVQIGSDLYEGVFSTNF